MKNHLHTTELTDDQAAQYTAWTLVIAALIAPVPVAVEANHWAWLLPVAWLGLLAWVWSRSR